MDKRTMALAYVTLVGLPLLGLVGILRAGSHLTAPIAVRGDWTVDADFKPWRATPCGQLLTAANQPLLSFAQSASGLKVTLNNREKSVLSGMITGITLNASLDCPAGPAGNPGSIDPRVLRLQADVRKEGNQKGLTGVFRLDGCAGCPDISFVAVRGLPERSTGL